MTKCRVCGIELTEENWMPSLMNKNCKICRNCNNDKGRKWRQENRKRANEMALKHYRLDPKKHHIAVHKARIKLRLDMIQEYGGKCNHCGIADVDVLDIDHINNNGAKHRKKGLYGYNLYRYLKKLGFPKDEYQLLCRNCNWKKELKRRREGSLSGV
jgi:hypothetical protein